MASLRYGYDDLIAPGSYTTTTGTASTLNTDSVNRAMRAMEDEMRHMAKEADMERQRRREMEKMMYYGSNGRYGYVGVDQGYMNGSGNAYNYPSAGTPCEPKSQAPSHTCSAKGNKRHDSYTAGIVEYHRKKGIVDVEALEKICSEPACVLTRIKES